MASLIKRPNGHWWVQFGWAEKRHTVRLGKIDRNYAMLYCAQLEKLIECRKCDWPIDEQWLSSLNHSRPEYKTLVKSGLIDAQSATIADLMVLCIDERDELKDGTILNYNRTRVRLIEFFGRDCLLRSIDTASCQRFIRWLSKRMAPATVARRGSMCRGFWECAVRQGWLARNPWMAVRLPSHRPNVKRQEYIPSETVRLLLDRCPSAEFGAILAMVRWGALRCTSEIAAMHWKDVVWDRDRICLRSPKTEHHAGKDRREIPIHYRFRPYLEEWFGICEPGEMVFPMAQGASAWAVSNRLQRLQELCGIRPWKKPWHNLRASCVTDWAETYPIQVVTAWAGHSAAISQKHYLQVLDSHFEHAAKSGKRSEMRSSENLALSEDSVL